MDKNKKILKPDEQDCGTEESEEIQKGVFFETLMIRGAQVGLVQSIRKKKRESIDC